jgi:hypothetical protein
MALVTLLLGLIFVTQAKAEILPVYYSTIIPVKDRENIGKQSGIQTIVFGQYRDFIDNVKTMNPSAVIAPAWFGKFHEIYKPKLQFLEKDVAQEKYKIVTLDAKWNTANLKTARVGVLEEIDRSKFSKILQDLTGTDFKLVKSVSKPENLLSMLVFKAVDVVFISESNLATFNTNLALKLKVIKTTDPVNKPILYVKENSDSDLVVTKVKNLPKTMISGFGFSDVKYFESSSTLVASNSEAVSLKSPESSSQSKIMGDNKKPVVSQNLIQAKKILLVRIGTKYFTEVFEEMKKDLADYNITEFIVEKGTDYESFYKKVNEVSPDLFILMDNPAVVLAKKFNLDVTIKKKIPGVALMALNLKKVLKDDQNIAGITFETPVFSIVTGLTDLFELKPKNVLVLYRKSEFQATIESATEHLARIGVVLDAKEIDDRDKSENEIKAIVKTYLAPLRTEQKKYDAVWVMLDSILLRPVLFKEIWLPEAKLSKIPFVVGLEELASKEMDFATFAVTPDLTNLAHQATEMVSEILDANQAPSQIGVEELIATNRIVNLHRVEALGLRLNDKQNENVKFIK